MDTAFAGGLAGTLLGLVGYVAGIAVPYPGRAFSVTTLMIGVTLLAVGSWGGSGASNAASSDPTDGATDRSDTATNDRSDVTTDSTGASAADRPETDPADGGRR